MTRRQGAAALALWIAMVAIVTVLLTSDGAARAFTSDGDTDTDDNHYHIGATP